MLQVGGGIGALLLRVIPFGVSLTTAVGLLRVETVLASDTRCGPRGHPDEWPREDGEHAGRCE